jgi:hypothetical protein
MMRPVKDDLRAAARSGVALTPAADRTFTVST